MNKRGIANRLDQFSIATGRATAWLTLLMVLVTVSIVVLRYVFGTGAIWLQELVIWMHGAVFMLGAAYTLQGDGHVRVDVFYRDMNAHRKAWVNLLGVLLFLFPLCALFFYESFNYVAAAWRFAEVSRNAGGLPYPAIPLLKCILLVMPTTISLQGLSLLLNSIMTIRQR